MTGNFLRPRLEINLNICILISNFDKTLVPPEQYFVTINQAANGVISASSNVVDGIISGGEAVSFTFTPASGYLVKKAIVNGKMVTLEDSKYTMTNVQGNILVTAEYTTDTLKASTINGTTTGSTNRTVALGYSSPVDIDFVVEGTPTPTLAVVDDDVTGAVVTGNRLTIPTGLAANDYTIGLSATNSNGTATHTINFKVSRASINYYNITVNTTTGGTATGGGSFAENDTATVIATPSSGYLFKQWTEKGVTISQSDNYSFKVKGNRTLTAKFEEIPPNPDPSEPRSSEPRSLRTQILRTQILRTQILRTQTLRTQILQYTRSSQGVVVQSLAAALSRTPDQLCQWVA